MPGEGINRERLERPEILLRDLLRRSVSGALRDRAENVPVLFRAIVVAVDVAGGQLENPAGGGSVHHVMGGRGFDVPATVGPENPRNSIRARVISDGVDQFTHDDRLRTFWPFFPEHLAVPVKPGEYVYVIFEDSGFEHGLWVSKLPGHEDVNMYRGHRSFRPIAGSSLAGRFGEAPPSDRPLDTDDAAAESRSDGKLQELFGD